MAYGELFIEESYDLISQWSAGKSIQKRGQQPVSVDRGVPIEAAIEDWMQLTRISNFTFILKNHTVLVRKLLIVAGQWQS